jgi:hypothetical protein
VLKSLIRYVVANWPPLLMLTMSVGGLAVIYVPPVGLLPALPIAILGAVAALLIDTLVAKRTPAEPPPAMGIYGFIEQLVSGALDASEVLSITQIAKPTEWVDGVRKGEYEYVVAVRHKEGSPAYAHLSPFSIHTVVFDTESDVPQIKDGAYDFGGASAAIAAVAERRAAARLRRIHEAPRPFTVGEVVDQMLVNGLSADEVRELHGVPLADIDAANDWIEAHPNATYYTAEKEPSKP